MTRRTGLVNLESSKNEKLRILDFSRSSSLALASTVVFTIGQNPKTYEKQKAERFYILFLPVRVYLIVQELSTIILRKTN